MEIPIKRENIVSGWLLMKDGSKEIYGAEIIKHQSEDANGSTRILENKLEKNMETPKKVKTEIVYTDRVELKLDFYGDKTRQVEFRFVREENGKWEFVNCSFNVAKKQYYNLLDWQFLSEIYKLIQYHLKDLNK